MGGGLIQLVAYGAQDVYLTGNPQITYFKVVYRRHTNFSIECIEQPIDSAKFNGTHTVQILRNGDLATRLYLRAVLPAVTGDRLVYYTSDCYNQKVAWVRRVGHALIKTVELTIGGSQIDKHWGTWMDLWYELTHTQEQERGYGKMIGDVPELTELRGLASGSNETAGSSSVEVLPEYTLYIPLQFWFCRNTGLALPLIALQYHEVRVNLELEAAANLLVTSGKDTDVTPNTLALGSCGLMVDYIYLDSEERRRFAQVGHEYLIEQVQFNGTETLVASGTVVNAKHKLEFNHPSKELVFAPKVGAWTAGETFLAYTGAHNDTAWEDALNAAAENVAASMFVLSADTISNWTKLSLPDVNPENSAYVAPLTAISGLDITVLANNLSNVTVSQADSVIQVNRNILGNNNGSSVVYLGNKITSVLVEVDISGTTWGSGLLVKTLDTTTGLKSDLTAITTTEKLLPCGAVKVVSHTLTLEDVSVPVSDLSTGDRAETLVTGAEYTRDVTVRQPFNYGLRLDGGGNLVAEAQLKLNGHDRFSVQDGPYFNYVQPAQHHTRTPADGVNVYSFALHPEQHQPSGSANLSRIDTTILAVTYQDNVRTAENPRFTSLFDNTSVYIFDFSYNVLRVMSGMAGVAYAN